MAKIPRRLYTALALLCFVFSALAQEPTDKEIGFDRDATKKHLLEEKKFSSTKELNSELDKIRIVIVDNYRKASAYRSANPWVNIPESGCINMGFDNNTEGWAMYWANGFHSNNILLSDNTYNSTFSLIGGSTVTGSSETSTNTRIQIISGNTNDPVLGVVKANSDNVVRIGKPGDRDAGMEEVSKKFVLTAANSILTYSYAVVLNDSGHGATDNPYFQVSVTVTDSTGVNIPIPAACAKIKYDASTASGFGFTQSNVYPAAYSNGNGIYKFRTWTTNSINLANYVNLSLNPIVKISFTVSDCAYSGNTHEGWAYVEANCSSGQNVIGTEGDLCINNSLKIKNLGIEIFTGDTINWEIFSQGNNTPIYTTQNAEINYQFPNPGTYHIVYTIHRSSGCNMTFERDIVITSCGPCKYCASFNPSKGERYIISGWVKEQDKDGQDIQVKTYEEPAIKLEYTDVSQSVIGTEIFHAAGAVIDGWQRIYGEFTIPANIDDLRIKLVSGKKYYAYFDDIRVFPFNGSMKSYVYDQATQRLMAELDENNYATFYEYDTEGGLVRIKKETVEGVRTIQETRSSNPKKP